MIILDFGSGSTCRNQRRIVEEMLNALAEVDSRRQCTPKFQLWSFGSEPQCPHLDWEVFRHAVKYGETLGFRVTASVFDKPSLDFLLTLDPPFVKLANRPYLRHLARYVPRGIPIAWSFSTGEDTPTDLPIGDMVMTCVSNYPALSSEYESSERVQDGVGISDHTVGLDLWRRYRPAVYEKHFALETSTGPDAGPWCITPAALGEVLDGR